MPIKTIKAYCDGSHETVAFVANESPDFCPVCHNGIEPIWRYGWVEGESAYAVFQCPINDCRKLFISSFVRNEHASSLARTSIFSFKGSSPWKPLEHVFAAEVKTISEKFCEIYDESHEAEQRGLMNICGAGYRRALEFLIKDYLIKENECDAEKVREKSLGACINEYLDDKKIKECAKRAAWLGNDQTHYYRIWEDKDLNDLKTLIGLTVNWIHNDCLTKKFMSEMPKDKTKGGK